MRRCVAVHMLLFHKVPAVRRMRKLGAVTLLARFYACRTIQRFVRRKIRLPASGLAPVSRAPRDPDASMARAMRHILACTVAAAVDESAACEAYAADVQRLMARLCQLSPRSAFTLRHRCVDALLLLERSERTDAVVAALLSPRARASFARRKSVPPIPKEARECTRS